MDFRSAVAEHIVVNLASIMIDPGHNPSPSNPGVIPSPRSSPSHRAH